MAGDARGKEGGRHMNTSDTYRNFAVREARGHSARYEELAQVVAGHEELVALIDELPESKRQPNLLLAAARYVGGVPDDVGGFPEWTAANWESIRATMLDRRTQTKEAGRCAVLLPLLASLPQPLALIEVGASAGLCLYPDRYRYAYDDREVFGAPESAPESPVLKCRTTGPVPFPSRLPEVAWRAGVDLNPLDAHDPDDVRWLECLVWPDQTERLERLRGAIQMARTEPAHLVRGDLNEKIQDLVAKTPEGATPVILHSAVLAYLPGEARDAFARTVRDLPGHWISNEGAGALTAVRERLPRPAPEDAAVFVLALDEHPVAFTGPHGQSLDWWGW